MHPTARPGCVCLGLATGVLLALIAGCATAPEPAGPKVVIDGNQYVVLDAPTGSHMKRKVRIVDLKDPTIMPVTSTKVTSETDLNFPPLTTGEAMRAPGPPTGLGGVGGR